MLVWWNAYFTAEADGVWYGFDDVIEAIGDGHVFHNVAAVQNVGTSGRYEDLYLRRGDDLCGETHASEQTGHCFLVYFDADLFVYVVDVHGFFSFAQFRVDVFRAVHLRHFNRLDFVLRLTVNAEHRHHCV